MSKRSKASKFAAKRRLKEHFKGKSSCTFVPTETVAWYWWRIINKAAFNDKLPYPGKIIIRRLRGFDGFCVGKTNKNICEITLASNIHDKKLFIATIAHEMVHQWQFYFGSDLHHGMDFREWKLFFSSKFGIVL
jgi:hypothetical protein